MLRAWFGALTGELALRSEFVLETLRDNPFNYVLTPADMQLPMQYPPRLAAALASLPARGRFGRSQRLRARSGGGLRRPDATLPERPEPATVRRHAAGDSRRRPAARRRIHVAHRRGSCRDLAVLFCAACRAVGLAARFVSGYERDASLLENGDMHAWSEVYLEGSGWTGYDPSRALAVADSHVAVAAASDAAYASPVIGSFRGAATASLEHSIAMQVE